VAPRQLAVVLIGASNVFVPVIVCVPVSVTKSETLLLEILIDELPLPRTI
jgi:hypothetical protein